MRSSSSSSSSNLPSDHDVDDNVVAPETVGDGEVDCVPEGQEDRKGRLGA